MHMKAALLMGNPCDEEEDNLALLCCQGTEGELLLLSRLPGEDEVELVWDEQSTHLRDLKVTLGASRLRVELPADAEEPFSAALLSADLADALADLDDAEAALRIILEGTGTLVME
ncbi:hypothetical protein [Pseudomonas sp. RIT-PI-S]|uniref:hypothetical protein n=1 Tax=Pseudomonas sp. RIT-PI-S TaxID=3035295 RepID=UPI0021D9DD5D|nr:hypothetical protein [Pseudomonas sp. RIT-PI-S]